MAAPRVLRGHTGSVLTVAVTPDGRRVVSGSYDKTLRVWDLETGESVAVHFLGAAVDHVAEQFPVLIAGARGGRVDILRLVGSRHGLPLPPLSPRITTAARLWLRAPDVARGCWDNAFTATCDACGHRFHTPLAIIDTITGITRTARLGPDDSTSLGLPAGAWAEPRLLGECPHCHESLKFNPFVVDNRDRYPAA